MANNKTEVISGHVEPRYYQVYGDMIESKEVIEPISIVAGSGPICGFDWVDTTSRPVKIMNILDAFGAPDILKRRAKRVYLSDKNNNAGLVANAFNTPDGLISIAPDILLFNGKEPAAGWPNLSNPTSMVAFAIKATHTYVDSSSKWTPSVSDFDLTFLTLAKTGGGKYSPMDVSIMTRDQLNANILPQGWLNNNTEVLIGIYILGWDSQWDSSYKSIISALGYRVSLIPLNGEYPVKPFGMNPLDFMQLSSLVNDIKSNPLKYVNDNIIHGDKLKNGTVGKVKLSLYLQQFFDYFIRTCTVQVKLNTTSAQVSIPSQSSGGNWSSQSGSFIYFEGEDQVDYRFKVTCLGQPVSGSPAMVQCMKPKAESGSIVSRDASIDYTVSPLGGPGTYQTEISIDLTVKPVKGSGDAGTTSIIVMLHIWAAVQLENILETIPRE